MSEEMDEIWALYADDGGQSLDAVEQALLSLKKNPTDQEAIASLFRAMHTFKGNSRVLGLSVSESRAHLAEDLIGLVRDDGVRLDTDILELLLETSDALRGMMEESLSSRHDVDEAATSDLAERLRAMFDSRKGGDVVVAALEPEPEVAAEPAEARAMVFEPVRKSSLSDDPMYREIFSGMAHDTLREMHQAMHAFGPAPHSARDVLAKEAERLRFAADQIGIPEWPEALAAFLAEKEPSAEQILSVITRLTAMFERDFGARDSAALGGMPSAESVPASVDPIRRFFDSLESVLASIGDADRRLSSGEPVDAADLVRLADVVRGLAEPLDFARLVSVVDSFAPASRDLAEFRRAKFKFYEELASIADVALVDRDGMRVRPLAILRGWCAEGVFETLMDLGAALDQVRVGEDSARPCARICELLRLVYHACHHYEMETAAHLSMSLLDLFARAENDKMIADPVLLHIARSFLAAMELVFNAASAGDRPDMVEIEALFQKAAAATFASSGTVSSSHLEARLGLPKSFHKVLTPESVKTSLAAIEAGHHFYIVRADLNQSEDLASNFLGWIGSGAAAVISNITVFQGDVTLFDFLLSSPLDKTGLAEAIMTLDPAGTSLKVEMTLIDRKGGEANGSASSSETEKTGAVDAVSKGLPAQDMMSANMLESIGEIVTGQAMMHHTLVELADEDMIRCIETELRDAGGDWNAARESVRRYLEGWQKKIEKLVQVESQINSLLDRLQEEAIAVRNRPAALLLKPVAPYGESLARKIGRQVIVSTSGDETQLDFSTLENLKGPLRALAAFSIAQSIEAPERRLAAGKDERGQVRVGLVKSDEQVVVTIEDDGIGIDLGRIAQRARQLGWEEEKNLPSLILREGYGPVVNDDFGGEGTNFAEIDAALRAHGGGLRVVNLPSGGMRSIVTMPLAMVVLDGMVIRVGEVMYVVPIDSIQRIVHSGASNLVRISANDGRYMLKLAQDDVLPVQFLMQSGHVNENEKVDPFSAASSLAAEAASDEAAGEDSEQKHLFVIVGKATRRVALCVDELVGQQLVLIRPLQGYLSSIRGVTGCALLGSGGVGMVLEMGYVLGHA